MTAREREKQLRSVVLLALGEGKEPWYIADAIEGTQIFGATGSGKTTGSGRAIALSFLKNGFGGLVLTAKPDDRPLWEEYIEEARRPASDLVVVDLAGRHRFNFLDYEFNRPGRGRKLTHNVVNLFSTALEPGGAAQSTSDPYWEHALRQLLTNAIDTVSLSGRPLSLRAILDAILTAPRGTAFTPSALERSTAAMMLRQATRTKLADDDRNDLEQCVSFWGRDFAGLAERTRSVIVSSFTSRATSLLRGPLRKIFCGDGEPTFLPEDTHRGKVIVLDFPVKEFGDVGRFAQVLIKTIWQRATERRLDKQEKIQDQDGVPQDNPDFNPDFRPVFLWADESQHFVTTEDMYFQATARSSLAATVYLTQNISNYYAVMSGREPRAATDSLLGNLVTKIFHANGDPTTNEWGERLFAKKPDRRFGGSLNFAEQGSLTSTFQDVIESLVPASRFTQLRKGGPPDYRVQSIIFRGGKESPRTRSTFIEHSFPQPSTFA